MPTDSRGARKLCFNGCSITYGEGFDVAQRDCCFPALIAQRLDACYTNLARPGSSNRDIFLRSAEALLSGNHDILITQWTALNRLWLYPAPFVAVFVNQMHRNDFDYRGWRLDLATRQRLSDLVTVLNHDYHNILDLIQYCRILESMAGNVRVVHVNGIVPWQDDLLLPAVHDLSSDLSSYSKSMLDLDHRDDADVLHDFHYLQQKFAELDRTKWVNLFHSFHDQTQDQGPQGHHPGPQSHAQMAHQILEHLHVC